MEFDFINEIEMILSSKSDMIIGVERDFKDDLYANDSVLSIWQPKAISELVCCKQIYSPRSGFRDYYRIQVHTVIGVVNNQYSCNKLKFGYLDKVRRLAYVDYIPLN